MASLRINSSDCATFSAGANSLPSSWTGWPGSCSDAGISLFLKYLVSFFCQSIQFKQTLLQFIKLYSERVMILDGSRNFHILLKICCKLIVWLFGCRWRLAGLRELLQPCSRAARKWRENEEMEREWGNGKRKRKWTENEERDRIWGNGQRIRNYREWGNGKKMRKWKENEEMERAWWCDISEAAVWSTCCEKAPQVDDFVPA